MLTYQEIRSAFGSVLPKSLAKPLSAILYPSTDWFKSTYQSKVGYESKEEATISQLLQAVQNSEELFHQYPVDNSKVKAYARSVLIDDNWLKVPPRIAKLDTEEGYYMVGGRHRVYAIAAGLAQLCYVAQYHNDKGAEDLFETVKSMVVKVDLVYVPDKEHLVQLVAADNESRTMRKAEHAHIKAQQLGAGGYETEDIVAVAAGNEKLTPREQVQVVAQVFTRRTHPRLKPQTLQTIGERVATYILFGKLPGEKLTRGTSLKATDLAKTQEMMNKAYSTMCDVVQNMDVVAKNSSDIALQIVKRLEEKPLLELEDTDDEEEDSVF